MLLLLDYKRPSSFDFERVRLCLNALPGVRALHESDRCVIYCEYDFEGDTTVVELSRDLSHLTIRGMGPASLHAARAIQCCYGKEIYAIDEGCSFNIPLSTVATLADFEDKMERQVGGEDLEADR